MKENALENKENLKNLSGQNKRYQSKGIALYRCRMLGLSYILLHLLLSRSADGYRPQTVLK